MRVELRRVFINESRDKESIYQGEHLSRRVEIRRLIINYFFW